MFREKQFNEQVKKYWYQNVFIIVSNSKLLSSKNDSKQRIVHHKTFKVQWKKCLLIYSILFLCFLNTFSEILKSRFKSLLVLDFQYIWFLWFFFFYISRRNVDLCLKSLNYINYIVYYSYSHIWWYITTIVFTTDINILPGLVNMRNIYVTWKYNLD